MRRYSLNWEYTEKPVVKVHVYGKAEFKIEYDRAGFD